MAPFESLGTVSEILVENLIFFIAFLHSTPLLGGPRQNIPIPFGVERLEWCGYHTIKRFKDMFGRSDKILGHWRVTDGRADILRQHSPRCAVKTV